MKTWLFPILMLLFGAAVAPVNAQGTPAQEKEGATEPQGPGAPSETNRKPVKPKTGSGVQELGTVTVTASKRAQALEKVPGSVAALQGDALEKMGAQGMEDYLKLVPGVVFNRTEADIGVPVIRGIATSNLPNLTQVPVGIFVDDIPLTDLFMPQSVPDLNPFDLERVEVLKGPQGTLFGSGALAGAVRYITKKPELNVWQSKLMGSYASVDRGDQKPLGAGMINIPIGHTAAIRAVGLYHIEPGYIDDTNRGLKDVNELRQSDQRVLGKWLPTDRLSLTATYLRQRGNQLDLGFADQRQRLERSDTSARSPRKSQFYTANFSAQYGFDWGTLLSSTNRLGKGSTLDQDLERVAGAPLVQHGGSTVNGWLQEVRLASPEGPGPWRWLGGLAYLRYNQDLLNVIPNPATDSTGPDAQLQFISADSKATEKALFGEVTRTLGERLELTAGARIFQTRLRASELFAGQLFARVLGMPEETQRTRFRDSSINPRFSARYVASPNVSTYALAAKGFQFGGVQPVPISLFQGASAGGQDPAKPFGSSKLWNFELGTRTEWWAHRLRFDATLFYLKWRDLQIQQVVQTAAGIPVGFITNVGRAHSAGAELAFQATPYRGVTFLSNAAWIEALTNVDFDSVQGPVPKGTRLPGSARFQMSNVLSYEIPFTLPDNLNPGISLVHTHTGQYFNDLQQSAELGNFETFDIRTHLLKPDLRWQPDLTFALDNVLDKRGVTAVLPFFSPSVGAPMEDVYFIKPRTFTAWLAVRF